MFGTFSAKFLSSQLSERQLWYQLVGITVPTVFVDLVQTFGRSSATNLHVGLTFLSNKSGRNGCLYVGLELLYARVQVWHTCLAVVQLFRYALPVQVWCTCSGMAHLFSYGVWHTCLAMVQLFRYACFTHSGMVYLFRYGVLVQLWCNCSGMVYLFRYAVQVWCTCSGMVNLFRYGEPVQVCCSGVVLNGRVQCNRLLHWCPAADCGHVIKAASNTAKPVTCVCGHTFW